MRPSKTVRRSSGSNRRSAAGIGGGSSHVCPRPRTRRVPRALNRDGIELASWRRMPRPAVEITVSDHAGERVVALAGELDIFGAGRVAVTLNDAVRRSSSPVVVDLGGLAFVDSAGLAVLVNAARRLDHAGRPFHVRAPAGPPRRAIELARLGGVLRLVDGRGAAAGAVAS